MPTRYSTPAGSSDAAAEGPLPPAKQEAARNVARPSRGKVIGYVLDAQSRHPLAGVRVTVEEDGTFPTAANAT